MAILIADDERSLRGAIVMMLADAGYETVEAATGAEAVALAQTVHPDLVVLDINLPDISGFEVCDAIRRTSAKVPILFLSARGAIEDKMVAFKTGGDDYLTKPFSQMEFLLRVEALLRRASFAKAEELPPVVELQDLRVDLERREVYVGGERVPLTPKEYRILALLAEHRGKTFTRQEITDRVWGDEFHGQDVGLPTHIRHLREKIEADPARPVYVQTVGRLGYRLGE